MFSILIEYIHFTGGKRHRSHKNEINSVHVRWVSSNAQCTQVNCINNVVASTCFGKLSYCLPCIQFNSFKWEREKYFAIAFVYSNNWFNNILKNQSCVIVTVACRSRIIWTISMDLNNQLWMKSMPTTTANQRKYQFFTKYHLCRLCQAETECPFKQ